MKKIKEKFINGNKYKKFFKEENIQIDNTLQNKYMITESNLLNNSLKKYYKFGQTTNNFYKPDSKFREFKKTVFQDDLIQIDRPNKIKLKLNYTNNINKRNINSYPYRYILPYVNSNSKNKDNLNKNKRSNIQINNNYKKFNMNSEYLIKDSKNKYNKIMVYNKTENIGNAFDINRKQILNNDLKIINKRNIIDNENKYKYSLILKSLDIWDKDHCEGNIKKSDINIYNYLNKYYMQNNLIEEQKNLIYVTNILNSRQKFDNLLEEGKQNNKIFIEMIKMKRKETGIILKNNLYKAQLKFSELFNKKYSKEFNEDLDIDADTLNLLIEDELKSEFYNQVIKERIKYENQLHDELLKINNFIYEKKNKKDEKITKLKQLFTEKNKLKKEYNEKYNKNRKTYWYKYDNYEQHFNKLITNTNKKAKIEIQNKIEKLTDSLINKKFFRNQTKILDNAVIKSPSPKKFKRRLSAFENKIKEDLNKQLKEIEEIKNYKLLNMNNEMNSELKEIYNKYFNKIDKINKEEIKLEKEIKILKLELEYFKKINDILFREHKFYYMNKLKKGYDCRKEGLVWIVANLLELQIPLEYHHFPKYLKPEQIDYLKKLANLKLKQNELKIIINALKKKRNTQKMKDILKCMDVIDTIIDIDNTNENEENFGNFNELNLNENKNKEYLITKNNINKKFMKIYKDNIDIMKNYIAKDAENIEYQHIINELKKDLYHGSNSDINKSKRDILSVFMGDSENKNFFQFLLDIKSNYQLIEKEKEKLFQTEKNNYLELVKSCQNHKATISNVVKNEMIKKCLFGTRLEQ